MFHSFIGMSRLDLPNKDQMEIGENTGPSEEALVELPFPHLLV
jgi:hypothetical protein